jgi:hypothetical protein
MISDGIIYAYRFYENEYRRSSNIKVLSQKFGKLIYIGTTDGKDL